jgi:hypothetical protein
LQLSDPIPALGHRQYRLTCQMLLEQELIELLIVKGAEFRGQATEGTDKPELRGDEVNDQTKPSLLRKLEAILGFMLHLGERISRGEKVRVQVFAAVRRKSEVADLVSQPQTPGVSGHGQRGHVSSMV